MVQKVYRVYDEDDDFYSDENEEEQLEKTPYEESTLADSLSTIKPQRLTRIVNTSNHLSSSKRQRIERRRSSVEYSIANRGECNPIKLLSWCWICSQYPTPLSSIIYIKSSPITFK